MWFNVLIFPDPALGFAKCDAKPGGEREESEAHALRQGHRVAGVRLLLESVLTVGVFR